MARQLDDDTGPVPDMTGVVTTLNYRAYEILIPKPHYTAKIDVWSLAASILELINLSPIFIGYNIMQMKHDIERKTMNIDTFYSFFKHKEIYIKSDVRYRIILNICFRMLDKCAKRRYSATKALERLQSFLALGNNVKLWQSTPSASTTAASND
jgi:serine/threonine protein kinase